MNRERLTQLIRVLEEVQALGKPWDMTSWLTGEGKELTCGTAACALGWATQDAWMQGEGLILKPSYSKTVIADWCPSVIDSDGREKTGFWAGAAFFALNLTDSYKLFSANEYLGPGWSVTVQMVIDRVQELLRNGGLGDE